VREVFYSGAFILAKRWTFFSSLFGDSRQTARP